MSHHDARRWRIRWIAIFAFNLVVPVWFGWLITEQGGRAGMFLALVPLWLWADWLGQRSPRFAYAMSVGGTCTGLLQIYPLLQMVAGVAALSLAGVISADNGFHLSGPRSFVAAVATGGVVQAVALAIGEVAYRVLVRPYGGLAPSDAKAGEPGKAALMFDREIDPFG